MLSQFLISILATGIILEIAAFLGFFTPLLSIIIVWPIFQLWKILFNLIKNLDNKNNFLKITLILIWVSHAVQIFVAETGFDALWYHLPIAKEIAQNHKLIYLPNLYQSANPQFADLFFLTGWQHFSDFGAKMIAYFFGLATILITYQLARKFLSRKWSLLAIITISSFQVISWQSSSFYVDLTKAFFEISSLYFLYLFLFDTKSKKIKSLILSGLFFSASLASKLFSIFLLPVMLILTFSLSPKEKIKNTTIFLISSLPLVLPFYRFANLNTSNPFYSLNLHLNKLGEIGGETNVFSYFAGRTILLPLSPIFLASARDYTSLIFLIFLPIAGLALYHSKLNKRVALLFVFGMSQFFLWWYLPPPSTRYALSGFIVLAILLFYSLENFTVRYPNYKSSILFTIYLCLIVNLAPRIFVNMRSFKYISGQQTKQEYLNQFMDGNIDEKINEWHFRATQK